MAADKEAIAELWERRAELGPGDRDAWKAVSEAIDALDSGELRVAEVQGSGVIVHEWVKWAILLAFRLFDLEVSELGPFEFVDRIPLKRGYRDKGVRVVPGASVRWGSYLGPASC